MPKQTKTSIKTKAKLKSKIVTAKKYRFNVQNISFMAEDLKCGGRLYLPAGVKKPPIVIMAHGFGAEMSFGISAYAEKFAENGYAALTFDYRYFGVSEGEPRHLISAKSQLKDWSASIEFVRGLKEVNGEKICIWGYSFSGGHVIAAAGRYSKNVRAFISHVPFLDSLETMKQYGFIKMMKVNFAAVKDLFNKIMGRPPYTIPVYGKPEIFAALNTPESYEGYSSFVPEKSDWKNEFPARSALKFAFYRPVKYIPDIECRGLVIYAQNDSFTVSEMLERAFVNMPDIKLMQLPCGHFEIFKGEYFKKASDEEIRFLKGVFS